jgi:5-methylthioadenosine/S-adenosylhomocysteine deaminase
VSIAAKVGINERLPRDHDGWIVRIQPWESSTMSKQRNGKPTTLRSHGAGADEPAACAQGATSRREFLKSSAGLVASGSAAGLIPGSALAQAAGAGDAELARVQARRRILLKGGVVLTLDRQVGDFAQADVLIEDGKIREVRPSIAVSDATSGDMAAVIDAANRIIIPGFVDTHSHSYQGLLRNILTNGVLNPDYNRDVQTVLTPAYAADDAYAGMLATALGMIDMGTTAVVDISQVSHTPEHSDACIRALQESGIRAVFAYHRGAGPQAQYPQDIKRLQPTYFSSKDQLLTLALTANLNANVFALAREVGVPVVQHLVGNELSGQLIELGRAGLLRAGDEYIHCLGINDAAWRLIKDTGGNISICAPIDMAMGHGMPAIQEALDHGIRPSLSSDHGVTIAQDFFTVMRSTFTLQRLLILQRARKGEQNLPPLLTCRDMLELATIAGARCANLEGKIGTLTPGKDADIVMLAADRLDVWPLNNAPGVVVNLMNPSHVDTVFIAGKVKKWRGSLVGVDAARVRRLVADARDAVLRRAGFKANLLG